VRETPRKLAAAALVTFVAGAVAAPLLSFLAVAVSPRLFDQGRSWFTVAPLGEALQGPSLVALGHTAIVGVGAGVLATVLGGGLAYALERGEPYGRRLFGVLAFALLLAPSYLLALGLQRLIEPGGVLEHAGLASGALRAAVISPYGVVGLLALKGAPFAYLTVGPALPALGTRLTQAARIHGGSRVRTLRVVAGAVAPALWAAFAVVFAESISDFGIAYTLGSAAHFELATFYLYSAVESEPIQFPLAAAIGLALVGLCAVALLAQRVALRGRSYALMRGGAAGLREPPPRPRARLLATLGCGCLFAVALGPAVVGTVSASLLRSLGTVSHSFAFTLSNYARVWDSPTLLTPLAFSATLAAVAASAVCLLGLLVVGFAGGRRDGFAGAALELVTLAALGVPAVVLGAGFILFWNLPALHAVHIALYGTTGLLLLGYIAGTLPSGIRLLGPPIAQLHGSLFEGARVHGAGWWRSWWSIGLPLLSRPLLYAWLWAFVGILLELPLSALLYPPGHYPLAVAISRRLEAYDYAGGTAMEVVAVVGAIALCGLLLAAYRRFAPKGLRAIGVAR